MSYQSAALTEKESAWVSDVAGRLRVVQADGSVANPQQRREFLKEELARSLKQIAAADRKRFLEVLLARFPVAGQVLRTAAAPSEPTVPSAPVREPFEHLLERVCTAAAGLDEQKQLEAAKRLAAAGLTLAADEASVLEIGDELQKFFAIPPGQQPEFRNVAKLCILLVDALQRLDQTALATLRELAPKSALLKRPQDFRSASGQFVSGKVESESIEPYLRVISALLGALLAAMLGGGRDFGRHFNERLSPGAIEDVVVGEGGGGLMSGLGIGKSKNDRCWERYQLLFKDYETPDLVDRRIRDCMAAFVERKVLSAR